LAKAYGSGRVDVRVIVCLTLVVPPPHTKKSKVFQQQTLCPDLVEPSGQKSGPAQLGFSSSLDCKYMMAVKFLVIWVRIRAADRGVKRLVFLGG
jgi:hypothetical protein